MEINVLKNRMESLFTIDTSAVVNIENLEDLLTKFFQELIDFEFERLLIILYRLDVSEGKVKSMLAIDGPANAARNIAILVIEREQKKIVTRKEYQQNTNNTDWEFDI